MGGWVDGWVDVDGRMGGWTRVRTSVHWANSPHLSWFFEDGKFAAPNMTRSTDPKLELNTPSWNSSIFPRGTSGRGSEGPPHPKILRKRAIVGLLRGVR